MLDEDMVALGKGTLSIFNALRDGRLQIKGRIQFSAVLWHQEKRIFAYNKQRIEPLSFLMH